MSQNSTNNTSQLRTPITIIFISLIIFAIFGLLWWRNIYMSSERVFWGMMNNNLATASVTKHMVQGSGDQKLDQYVQLQFGVPTAVRNYVTITQPEQNGQSVVTSETIGTNDADYSRYISIAGSPDIDAAKVINIWGKTPDSKPEAPVLVQYLQQSVLGVVPFANFSAAERQRLIRLMQEKNVYDISAAKPRPATENSRSVYVYQVSISPKAFIEMTLVYAKALGISVPGVDPEAYAGSPPLQAEFTVDKVSRQLVKISYGGGEQQEVFSAYGLEQPITLPSVTIPIDELQKRVQQSLQPVAN